MIASSRSSFLQHGVHNGVVIYARCTGLLCWSCVAVRCSVLVVLCCLFASDASQLHDLASSDRQKLCKDDVHNAMRALRRPCAAVGCCSPSGCTLLLSASAWHAIFSPASSSRPTLRSVTTLRRPIVKNCARMMSTMLCGPCVGPVLLWAAAHLPVARSCSLPQHGIAAPPCLRHGF